MYRVVFLALLVGGISPALADGVVHGTVVRIRVDKDGKGMVFFSQPVSGALGCVDPVYASALGFDTALPGGKSMLAAVLAAKATGDTITAFGTGTCDSYNVTEDLSYAEVQ